MTEQEEKDYIKKIFSDTYRFLEKWNRPLKEEEWDACLVEADEIYKKYKDVSPAIKYLCRKMIAAVLTYKETK